MKIFKKISAVILLSIMMFGMAQLANAAVYEEFLEIAGETVELPSYQDDAHAGAYGDDVGLSGITSSIYYAIDFIKYGVGGIAVLFIVISAYRLIVAGKSSEEEITKQKVYLTWAVVGLLLIFMADTVVKEMFFGEEGEILTGDTDQTLEFAYNATKAVRGLYTMLEAFVGVVAVFMIAYEGFRMVSMAYNDEQVKKSKDHIFWSLIALFMIGISELIVKDILFKYEPGIGVDIDIVQGRLLLANIANFVSGLVGLISVGMLIYGGYMYVTGSINEENQNKAKKVIFGAIIGIIIAGAAFAITTTAITLEP